jgi:CRISPR/Cas system CSM-associated protein Csm2 small subunit
MDLPSVRERAADVQMQFEKMGYRLYLVSGLTGEGMEELVEAVSEALEKVASHGEGS